MQFFSLQFLISDSLPIAVFFPVPWQESFQLSFGIPGRGKSFLYKLQHCCRLFLIRSHNNSLLAALNTNTGICCSYHLLRKSLGNCFTYIFSGKPTVKKDYGMLIFIPLLKVIFIYMPAFLRRISTSLFNENLLSMSHYTTFSGLFPAQSH